VLTLTSLFVAIVSLATGSIADRRCSGSPGGPRFRASQWLLVSVVWHPAIRRDASARLGMAQGLSLIVSDGQSGCRHSAQRARYLFRDAARHTRADR